MAHAVVLAQKAWDLGEVPVGAIVVKAGEIIGSGYNQPIRGHDPTAHAEIMAIKQAAQTLGNYRLPGASLYVTIEPCMMCAGAMIHARIGTLIYAAAEPKAGVVSSQLNALDASFLNHRIDVVAGVMADECADLMRRFFTERRASQRRQKK